MMRAITLIPNPIIPTMTYNFNLVLSTGSIVIKRLTACTKMVKLSDKSNIQLTMAPTS